MVSEIEQSESELPRVLWVDHVVYNSEEEFHSVMTFCISKDVKPGVLVVQSIDDEAAPSTIAVRMAKDINENERGCMPAGVSLVCILWAPQPNTERWTEFAAFKTFIDKSVQPEVNKRVRYRAQGLAVPELSQPREAALHFERKDNASPWQVGTFMFRDCEDGVDPHLLQEIAVAEEGSAAKAKVE